MTGKVKNALSQLTGSHLSKCSAKIKSRKSKSLIRETILKLTSLVVKTEKTNRTVSTSPLCTTRHSKPRSRRSSAPTTALLKSAATATPKRRNMSRSTNLRLNTAKLQEAHPNKNLSLWLLRVVTRTRTQRRQLTRKRQVRRARPCRQTAGKRLMTSARSPST